MNLSEIEIKNFKRISNICFDVNTINILVGENGSGKSSILQAIHLATCAIRQAKEVRPSRSNNIPINNIDFLPTDFYKKLGFDADWGNAQTQPESRVTFEFSDENEDDLLRAYCVLKSARNSAGISITGEIPSTLSHKLRKSGDFFSAYIPGLSGVPNRETKLTRRNVYKISASGESNSVFRNILHLLDEEDGANRLLEIQEHISSIIGDFRFKVKFDPDRDLHITSNVIIGGNEIPIELLGTGFLQLIQIFTYLYLFKPDVILVDEPDAHLHPTVQEKFVPKLQSLCVELGVKAILTTHSPFIVRGATRQTNVFWLKEGRIIDTQKHRIERRLGWGISGKKVLLISEDRNLDMLREILDQWPDLAEKTAIWRGGGYRSLPTPEQCSELMETIGGDISLVIHRDRDFMTDDEQQILSHQYSKIGAILWIPKAGDLEGHYCSPTHVSEVTGLDISEVERRIEDRLVALESECRQQFNAARATAIQLFHLGGGGPIADQIWQDYGWPNFELVKGKYLLKKINSLFESELRNRDLLELSRNSRIAPDLKSILDQVAYDS